MPNGPGKYDDAATIARVSTSAEALVLIVLNGHLGSGFSVQAHANIDPAALATMLEYTAQEIRASTVNVISPPFP